MTGSGPDGPVGRRRRTTEVHAGGAQPATDLPGPDVTAERLRLAVVAGHQGDEATAVELTGDPDPQVRAGAIGALARMGALTPTRAADALRDRSPEVRRRTCEELGRRLGRGGPDTEVLALLSPPVDDPDDAVAEAACWACGEAGAAGAQFVASLSTVAGTHSAPLCREAAVAALGAIGDERGLEVVIGALGDRPAIRRRAAAALAAFSGPEAEGALRRCLDDRDWQVRQIAEELLDI